MKRFYGTLVSFWVLQGLAVASQPFEEITPDSNADRLKGPYEINPDTQEALVLWLENHGSQGVSSQRHGVQNPLEEIKKLSELVDNILKQKTIEHVKFDPYYLSKHQGLAENLTDMGIFSPNNGVMAKQAKRNHSFFIYQPQSHGPIVTYSKDDLFLRGLATLVKRTFDLVEARDFNSLESYKGAKERLEHLTSYFTGGDPFFKEYRQFTTLRSYNNKLLDFLMAHEWHMKNFDEAVHQLKQDGAMASPEALMAYNTAFQQKNSLSRKFVDLSKEFSLRIQDYFLKSF